MKEKHYPILKIVLIVFMMFFSVSCWHNNAKKDIVETAIADGNFNTLVAALEAAGLDDDLKGPGPFTVFAPTDDAFSLLPAGTIDALLDPANQDILVDILTFHVYGDEVYASDVVSLNGTGIHMLNGSNLRIDVIDGDVILSLDGDREATVTMTDLIASNGVIHVIDVVLNPDDAVKTIVDTALENGNFNTLLAALEAAGLDDDLKGPGPFTVFAPIDDAFADLPAGTVDVLLLPENKGILIDILTYHVYNGSVLAADAIGLDGSSAGMLNDGNMTIDVISNNVVLNEAGNRPSTVIIVDVLCSNGVIHVIDTVLDPGDSAD